MDVNNYDQQIQAFIEITSSTIEEAYFYLESHNFDLAAAVSTFLESNSAVPETAASVVPPPRASPPSSPTPSGSSPSASLFRDPSRSVSPPPPQSRSLSQYDLRSRGNPNPMASSNPNSGNSNRNGGRDARIRTFSDLNRSDEQGSDSDSDRPPEYYTGGEKSGMLVQDKSKNNDVDALFNRVRQLGAVEGALNPSQPSSSSRSFVGTGRLLSGETVPSMQPQHPEVVTYTFTFWRNGFTVNDGPLRRFDDPENASLLNSIRNSECPAELEPADRRTKVQIGLVRKDENCPEPEKRQKAFQGVGRTLGSSSSSIVIPPPATFTATRPVTSAPSPTMGLVVDPNLPSTSVQLRLADGTRMVSRFNHHHTIRDIRGFIDASRAGGSGGAYKLQMMGFPPKELNDLDQTIEEAGLANSVVIQKF
ncbi:Plant UBX domain-containing protein 4 [Dionaea muscipula]